MTPFEILEKNPLKKLEISRFRWLLLGENNEVALPGSTKAEVLALIPDTIAQNLLMRGIITGMASGMTDRRMNVSGRNTAYSNFYKELVDSEDPIKKAFKLTPDVYNIEFFAGNLGEYDRPIVSQQGFLTARLKALTDKYSLELGLPMKTIFADLDAAYILASSKQRTATQKVKSNSTSYKVILDKYLDQMWKNMLVVAGAYSDTPGVAADYFTPRVLHAYHYTSTGVLIAKPLLVPIDPESIVLCDIAVKATEKLIAQNSGNKSFFLFSSDDLLELNNVPDDALEIEPGDEVMLEGSTVKKYIYVANKEKTGKAKAELSLM